MCQDFLLAFSLVLLCFFFSLSSLIDVLGIPLSVGLVQEGPKDCQQKIQNLFLVRRRQTGKALAKLEHNGEGGTDLWPVG